MNDQSLKTKTPVRIAIVEDDPTYVDVLRQVLARDNDLEVERTFLNSVEFLAAVPRLEVELIFLDIRMPKISGLECLPEIRQFLPDARVIMLTLHDDDDYVLRSFLAGADGYLLKDSAPRKILEAAQYCLAGGAPMSPSVARKVIEQLDQLKPGSHETDTRDRELEIKRLLSVREFEVLQHLADGKTYGEIAALLHVSVDTIKTHIRHIYDKLKVRNRTEAVSRMLR
ncbi:response regulator [bacterium]|nr:response regulator [bacterium]